MTNRELYNHYHKRLRLCRNIICDLPDRDNNIKWDRFVSLFRYYDDKLKSSDRELGRTYIGRGNYKSQFENEIKPERRNVGNYKSKLK